MSWPTDLGELTAGGRPRRFALSLPWTLFMLGYLILIALFYRGVLPAAMQS